MAQSEIVKDAKSVMVVSSNNSLRDFIQCVLENEGFQVVTARTSVQALLIESGIRRDIDLLITNIGHGGFHNGLDLAFCFRVTRPKAKILFTSGGIFPMDRIGEALPDGGYATIRTPFAPGQLSSVVKVIFQPMLSISQASWNGSNMPLRSSESMKGMRIT